MVEKNRAQVQNKWTLTKQILLGIIVIVIGLNGVLGYYLFLDEEEEVTKGAILRVDEVYFLAQNMEGEELELEVYMFITNQGEESCSTRVRAFIIDVDTNLAMDEKNADMGILEGQKTREGSIRVNVPNECSYRVELLVFKNEKVTVKGSGTVDLRFSGAEGEDYRTTRDDEALEDGYIESSKNETPSVFTGVGGILATGAVIIYLVRRRNR